MQIFSRSDFANRVGVATLTNEIAAIAADGCCEWLQRNRVELKLLLLTHGHIDHIADLAKIKETFACQVGCHPETLPMISDPNFFRHYGFGFDIKAVQPDFFVDETAER